MHSSQNRKREKQSTHTHTKKKEWKIERIRMIEQSSAETTIKQTENESFCGSTRHESNLKTNT